MQSKTDVLVIGAGPSGSVAAAFLADRGYNVKVVEKTKFPRFVIGESLLPRCMVGLEQAGLLEGIKEEGFQEKFGAKFSRGDEFSDFDFSNKFSEGWSWTWQVPRADFDDALIRQVAAKGADVCFETEVTAVRFEGTTSFTTVKKADGSEEEIEAQFIIDGSGYGRVLPRLLDLHKPSSFPARKAFFAHVNDKNRPEGADKNRIIIRVIERELWAWVIPFSNGVTSLGLVGNPEHFDGKADKADFEKMVQKDAFLKQRFESGLDLVFEPKVIEGYSAAVSQLYGDGYVLTGNSSEFLDPVFSSGVTFATESAMVAAKLVDRALKGEAVDWEVEFQQYIMEGVDVFRSYVKGWYDGTLQDIIFASNQMENTKKQICSVLAGYVWDKSNPYVKKHHKLGVLAQVIRMAESEEN